MSHFNATVKADDGKEFDVYYQRSKLPRAPGIVLIHEIFGVTAAMRQLVDEYAAAGFNVMAPDVFWRQQKHTELNPRDEADTKKAYALMKAHDWNQGIMDLQAVVTHLRGLPECTGMVGTLGFCMGGKQSFLMAANSDVDCAVAFYPGGIDVLIGMVVDIDAPLLIHLGGADAHIDKKAQATIMAGIEGFDHVHGHIYPGADHAFARPGGANYHAVSANQATAATLDFLAQNLK